MSVSFKFLFFQTYLLNLFIPSSSASTNISISFSVLFLQKLTRTALSALSAEIPKASGAEPIFPFEQAEPLDTYIPFYSRKWSIISLLTPNTEKFSMLSIPFSGLLIIIRFRPSRCPVSL